MSAECHVRKLRIRTRDKALLPRMTFVLEDALRTASFPGLPPNGKVYVRKLNIGKCSPLEQGVVLSRKIDKLFCLIRPVKIIENLEEHPAASAVWFPDDLSPSRYMIHFLAKNSRPTAWYWSAAIKGWRPELTVLESYQLILKSVTEHVTGISGLYFVLEPLIVSGKVHEVLDSFQPKEVSGLLMNLGIRQYPDINQSDFQNPEKDPEVFTVPPHFSSLISKAVRMWSVFDPRTKLLASVVLDQLGKQPEMIFLNRLFEVVSESEPLNLKQKFRSERSPIRLPVSPTPLEHSRGNDQQDFKSSSELDQKVEQSEMMFLNRLSGGVSESEPLETKQHSGVEKKNPLTLPDSLKNLDHSSVNAMNKEILKISKVEQSFERGQKNETKGRPHQHEIFTPEKDSRETPQTIHEIRKTEKRNTSPFREHSLTETWPSFGGLAGDLSEYTGLIFVISLMKRLGVDSLLGRYPDYRELNIPQRIIFRCAERLNIPENDPALTFAGEKPLASNLFVDFVAPLKWLGALNLAAPENLQLRLGRVNGKPGRRLILDAEEKLVLGVWHSENRQRLDPWLSTTEKPLGSAEPRGWSVQHLVENLIHAMERYLSLHAHMDLSELISRPAYISTTKTHLDVSIPFEQLDIRVRMAGIDINPGWVPWLGRVIQFHYVGGES